MWCCCVIVGLFGVVEWSAGDDVVEGDVSRRTGAGSVEFGGGMWRD